MNHVISAAALAVALFSSAAYAAGTTHSTSASRAPVAAPVSMESSAAECQTLGTQWETAEAANASNAKIGKAKAKALKAEKNCASTKASHQKTGVMQYTTALKLLGVTPTT